MEIEYEKGIGRNYILIEPNIDFINSYEYIMLNENTVPGLISPFIQYKNHNKMLAYDISGFESISSIANRKELSEEILVKLIISLASLGNTINEYMLSDKGVFINKDCVMYDAKTESFAFIYCGDTDLDFSKAMTDFAEFIINSVNHEDRAAVQISYEMYEQILNEDYSFYKLIDDTCIENTYDDPDDSDEREHESEIEDIEDYIETNYSIGWLFPYVLVIAFLVFVYYTWHDKRFFSIMAIALSLLICITAFNLINRSNRKKRRRMLKLLSTIQDHQAIH